MGTRVVVGVDMGTQSTKAHVVALDGTPVAAASVETALHQPVPGVAEQDPGDIEAAVLESVRLALAQAPADVDVLALGIDGQMGGAVGVDGDFIPVTPYESWLDARADTDRAQVLEANGTEIVAAGGIIPFVGPRVRRWLRDDPALRTRLAKVLAPTGYVVGRLVGSRDAGEATCDRTQAHLFGCYDVRAGRWDGKLATAMEVEPGWLPRVVDPLDVVGELSEVAAERSGLPRGTPVAAGLGDGTAGWVAAGAFTPGSCVDTGGSSEHFATTLAEFVPDPYPGTLLTCMPSAMRGRFHLFGFTAGTGLTRKWWTELAGGADYEQLERAAAGIAPRIDVVLAVPHLGGTFTPFDASIRGAFVGCDAATTAADMYRALTEAMAFEFTSWLDHVAALTHRPVAPRYATAIGGAAQSAVGARIKADVLGIPYRRMKPHVQAPRGAAIVAAAAVGARELDAASWCDERREVLDVSEPDDGAADVYRARAARYWELMEALRPLYRTWAANRGGASE